MTRYERKLYFEQLVALRVAYRAETHESTGMTIEQAMTFAEQAFNDAVAADAASIETALARVPRRPNDALPSTSRLTPRIPLSGASCCLMVFVRRLLPDRRVVESPFRRGRPGPASAPPSSCSSAGRSAAGRRRTRGRGARRRTRTAASVRVIRNERSVSVGDRAVGRRGEEARPAGAGLELRLGAEQLRAAAGAAVGPRPVLVPEVARERALGPLLAEDVVLDRRQRWRATRRPTSGSSGQGSGCLSWVHPATRR